MWSIDHGSHEYLERLPLRDDVLMLGFTLEEKNVGSLSVRNGLSKDHISGKTQTHCLKVLGQDMTSCLLSWFLA